MNNPSTRRTLVQGAVRVLRGLENALDRLGWDRLYRSPAAVEPVYSHNLTEKQLAKYQKAQGKTNDCAVYSVAAALNLLDDTKGRRLRRAPNAELAAQSADEKDSELVIRGVQGKVDYQEAVHTANRHAILREGLVQGLADFVAGQDYRVWPGGPTMPRNQKHLAERLAERHDMEITADALRGTTEDLLFLLNQPNTAVLVTIGWGKEDPPRILYPDGKFRRFGQPEMLLEIGGLKVDAPFNAHVMLLAAYDPAKTATLDGQQVNTPWGFINSWVDAGPKLYWMTEEDFRQAWRYVIPGVGRQKMVVVRRLKS